MNETMEETELICCECGCVIDESEAEEVDGDFYCQCCFEENYVQCSRCGASIHTDDAESDDDHYYCQDCFDDHYTRCADCGCIISRDSAFYSDDEDDPLCDDCYYNHERDTVVHEYSYKPEPEFFGDGDRYFGVELEIDYGGKDRDKAQQLLSLANRFEDNLYIKVDGSLDAGLELVTHPMSLEYHRKSMNWTEVLVRARELGYMSHKTDTCGLHIHVNRNTFGFSSEEQDKCISRVLYFVEHHWEEILKFSRRTASQMKRWAARYGYKDNPKEVLEYAKAGHQGRYTCVNITNDDTIEFRMFRGTLKLNTLIAAIQMVDAICEAAIIKSDGEIAGLSWTDFVGSLSNEKYPELVVYLKERQLYINEKIEFQEDD